MTLDTVYLDDDEDDDFQPPPNTVANIQKVTKNPTATLLMMRILDLAMATKGPLESAWVAHTHKEWALETGTTTFQTKRALALLSKLNLIERTTQKVSVKASYGTYKMLTLHVKPTKRAMALIVPGS